RVLGCPQPRWGCVDTARGEAPRTSAVATRRMGGAKRAGRCSGQEVVDSYTRSCQLGSFKNGLGPRPQRSKHLFFGNPAPRRPGNETLRSGRALVAPALRF